MSHAVPDAQDALEPRLQLLAVGALRPGVVKRRPPYRCLARAAGEVHPEAKRQVRRNRARARVGRQPIDHVVDRLAVMRFASSVPRFDFLMTGVRAGEASSRSQHLSHASFITRSYALRSATSKWEMSRMSTWPRCTFHSCSSRAQSTLPLQSARQGASSSAESQRSTHALVA